MLAWGAKRGGVSMNTHADRGAMAAGTMTRRDAIRLGAAAAAGAAVAPLAWTPAEAEEINWQRYKGTQLFLLFYKHPWVDEIIKFFPEFESRTGMKLQYEVI